MAELARPHDARPRGIVRVTADDDLRVARHRRVVAYRAECPCDWRGPRRSTYADARADAYSHNVAESVNVWVGR